MILNETETDATARTPSDVMPSGDDAGRERAVRRLRDAAFEVLLGSAEPQRTTDLARAVAERCGQPTDETSLGAIAALLRMVLDSDPVFVHTQRQWDLTARQPHPDADRRRPVERTIEELIQLLGKPATSMEVAPLVSAVYGRDTDYFRAMIERMAPTRSQFFVAPFGRIGLTRWLLDLSSDEPVEVEVDNFEDPQEVAAARAAAGKVAGAADADGDGAGPGQPLDYAQAVLRAAETPLTNRALTFVVWDRFKDVEPLALFNDLLLTTPEALRPGPSWEGEAARQADLAAIREMAASPELAQTAVAAAVPVEEEAAVTTPAQPVGDEDLEQVYDFMAKDLRTFRLSELCQEVLESFPGSRSYAAVRDTLRDRMRADSRFVWVGTERFRLDGTMPDGIDALPEGLGFDEREFTDDEGEVIDKLLPLERWKHLLEEQVKDPRVQDLGDDETRPSDGPEQVSVVIPLHHYVDGTLYIHHEDRPFFPLEPDFVSLSLVTSEGIQQEVWLNNRLGLLFGLKEWYEAHLPWTGGIFTIERTDQADGYRLVHTGETDPDLDIPIDRLQSLLLLRGAAEAEALSMTEVVTRILKGNTGGVSFARLFTEVNVVRRSRRHLVASVLSGHRGFQQKPDHPGVWMFDEKRADKARKGSRPKRFRELDDEDEFDDE